MISNRPTFLCTLISGLIAPVALLFGFQFTPGTIAQEIHPGPAPHPQRANAVQAELGIVSALFVSDIHFDPFHDPAKVKELVAAPVDNWRTILSEPSSDDQEQAFTALQRSCHARGVDTPLALLRSSLEAMRAREPDAKFMMVSGDLIAHDFTCRYSTLFPGATPGDYQAFVVKTLSFVMEELRAEFPGDACLYCHGQ